MTPESSTLKRSVLVRFSLFILIRNKTAYINHLIIATIAGNPNDPFFPQTWHLQKIGMPAVWDIVPMDVAAQSDIVRRSINHFTFFLPLFVPAEGWYL